MPPPRKKLGELLVEAGAIDSMQLQAGLGHHRQWGMRIGRALIERGFCRPEHVLQALAKQTGHPVVDLDNLPLDSRLVFNLNVKAAEKHRAVPLRLEGKRAEILVIAVAGPAGLETLDPLLAVSGKARVVPYLADDEAIERAIGKLYYNRQPSAPKPPPPKPISKAAVTGEQELELELETEIPTLAPAAAAIPRAAPTATTRSASVVLLYGWQENVARSLGQMLGKAGIRARVIDDETLLGCTESDTVFSTSLSLEALLPPRQRLPAMVIVAGMPDDEDMTQAKTLGVNVYLRAPLNTEQLVRAVLGRKRP